MFPDLRLKLPSKRLLGNNFDPGKLTCLGMSKSIIIYVGSRKRQPRKSYVRPVDDVESDGLENNDLENDI